MANNYGKQFEALMAEICVDFGRRLIRGWDETAQKEEVRKYVEESVAAFFAKPEGLSAAPPESKEPEEPEEPEEEEEEESAPKKKAPAKKKAKAKAVAKKKEPPKETEEENPKPKGKGKSKASATTKPKCKAVTAKGAPCSKNAVDGCEFCNVHRDKGETSVKPKEKAKAKAPVKAKAKAKGTKSKGLETKPESAKHAETHGPDETDPENCDLCKSHGGPFELPDYEAENNDKDPDFDIDEEVELESNGGGSLTEEDFDEDFC